MEHYDPTRRSYAPTSFPAQQPQQTTTQTAGAYGTPGSVDRFRQPLYSQQSPTPGTATGRVASDAQQLYNFSQGVQYATGSNMPAGTMQQYGQGYQPQEARPAAPQYQQYPANVMYSMQAQAQAQAQAQSNQPSHSPYEQQVAQFRQPRPPAPAETLPSQFAESQTAQYYLAGQSVPTSAPPSDLPGSQLPSQYQPTAYAQPPSSMPQSYAGAMLDPAQTAAYHAAYNQQPQYMSQHQQEEQQQTESVDQAFNRYQTQVRTIFTQAREGNLRDVHRHLMQISHYLLGSAEGLGLTRDDETLHDDRIKLWDEFNRAWLATLQRQHDLTQELIRSGQAMHESQSLMSVQALEDLARELVRLCDNVEKHGLVDYQMGVAEEDIMDLLLRCLALLDAPSDRPEPSTRAGASSAAAGR